MTEAPIWVPDDDRVAATRLKQFMVFSGQRLGTEFIDYQTLHRWSIDDPAAFWFLFSEFAGIRFDKPADATLLDAGRMPGARWFPGARMNFAENLLRYRDGRPAIIFRDEAGARVELSHAQLYRRVAAVADGLRRMGIGVGDRVAGFMPNHPQAVVAMLATTSIGAIWSSCSPDFGVNGVFDRFGQIRPRVLFSADGYRYGGKSFDSRPVIAELARRIPELERIVVVPFLDENPELASVPGAVRLDAFAGDATEIVFESLPFDHPVYIMYSSGTTGVPKCIVHGAGGTLIQHVKEHVLHTNLSSDDRLFYFTTCGWMMWNWLVSGLASGAAIVLYDGSPFYPDSSALWQIADEEQVTVFGSGAKYIAAVEKSGFRPGDACDLSGMHTVLSTGSPLAPAQYDFVYSAISSDVLLASIAGGTDLISCFALGNPILPVYRGELQCLGLGMAVEIYDDEGRSLPEGKGELVCTRPFPSMPVGFWDDADGRRYHGAYFERFPNVWAHGDYAELTAHGGLVIHGRSDAVLNPGGVRIGTAEIYRQVEKLDEVLESIAVGQQWHDDTRVILFVVLRDDVDLDETLQQRIRSVIRENTTPRHVPAKILAVGAIPRTISGKIVELAVRSVIHGEPVRNTDALANQEALEYFRDRPELQVD